MLHSPFKLLKPLKDHEDSIFQIDCGENMSGFLTTKGYLYTFGGNEYGQLAIGSD